MNPADLLSETAREMVDLIGLEPTIALSKALGGLEITMGGKWKEQIVQAVGVDAHSILADYYGPELVRIPTSHRALQLLHKHEATQLYLSRRLSGNEAALKANVTNRTIRAWARSARQAENSPQEDLFG